MKHTPRRSAFTLFHLIVLLALFALLLSLLFPFIQKAREEAVKRQTSQNHLKQLMLAVHNYHDVNGRMPAGNDANNFSAFAHLLPYVEQANLHKQIDFKKASDDPANAAVRATVVQTFLSPFDSREMAVKGSAPTNYFLTAGTLAALKNNNGAFPSDSKIMLTNFFDGTSNTVAMLESLMGDGGTKGVDVRRQHVLLKAAALMGLQKNAGVDDFANNKNVAGTRGASWMDGRFLMSTINAGRLPNDVRPDVSCEGLGGWGGPRTMIKTFNVAVSDGSVRSVSLKIDPQTWQNLINRMDGQVIGDF